MRYLIIVLAALAITACNRGAETPVPEHDPMLVRSYEVPEAAGRELVSSLNNLLATNDSGQGRLGRAQLIGRNRIAVNAPASLHPGIGDLVGQWMDTAPDEPERIRFHYWLVRATPAAESRIPATLQGIAEPLKALEASVGPLQFESLDYAEQVLRSGAFGQVQGRIMGGQVEAVSRQDRIAAEMQLRAPGGKSVTTEIDLEQGETLVLGLVGAGEEAEQAQFDAFVVRAETF